MRAPISVGAGRDSSDVTTGVYQTITLRRFVSHQRTIVTAIPAKAKTAAAPVQNVPDEYQGLLAGTVCI
jgi:hypothetical protein